jgi:transketolase
MTVIDVPDAISVSQVPGLIVDVPGPVYVRLKRGEIPVILDEGYELSLTSADVLTDGDDIALFASGMMLAPALAAARTLAVHDVWATVVNVPVIKPLDTATVQRVAARAKVVLAAENHSIIGGLGSAVAEAMAEAGTGRRLHRIGLADTFAEGSLTGPYLFEKYGLSTQSVIDTAWRALGRTGPAPEAPRQTADKGEYSPV